MDGRLFTSPGSTNPLWLLRCSPDEIPAVSASAWIEPMQLNPNRNCDRVFQRRRGRHEHIDSFTSDFLKGNDSFRASLDNFEHDEQARDVYVVT